MLCDSVPAIALQHCPSLATQVRQIADKHQQALLLFSACHIYVQNYVDTSEVDQLGKQEKYCLSYTYTCSYHLQLNTSNPSWDTQFPTASVTPKLHMPEEHVPRIKR